MKLGDHNVVKLDNKAQDTNEATIAIFQAFKFRIKKTEKADIKTRLSQSSLTLGVIHTNNFRFLKKINFSIYFYITNML